MPYIKSNIETLYNEAYQIISALEKLKTDQKDSLLYKALSNLNTALSEDANEGSILIHLEGKINEIIGKINICTIPESCKAVFDELSRTLSKIDICHKLTSKEDKNFTPAFTANTPAANGTPPWI